MTSAYDNYLKSIEELAVKFKDELYAAKTEATPQYLLWYKSLTSELEDSKAKCVTINETFYFTEILVNRLMHFTALMSQKRINETSYQKGWEACMDSVREKLGFAKEFLDN